MTMLHWASMPRSGLQYSSQPTDAYDLLYIQTDAYDLLYTGTDIWHYSSFWSPFNNYIYYYLQNILLYKVVYNEIQRWIIV